MAAAAVVSIVTLAGVAQPAPSLGAAARSGASAVAKTALLKGVSKVDRFIAKHGAAPRAARGAKLLRAKAPKSVVTTYAAVTGSRPGYCATAAPAGSAGKLWVHDSWLRKTWRTTAAQAGKAGGACAAVAQQDDAAYGRTEMKIAVDDAYTVSDAIDDYYFDSDVDALPAAVDDAWLAGQGVTLTPGSQVVGYTVYGEDADLYRFCLVRDSGAWAAYDDDNDIVGTGTAGAACTF
jgi:hypothetical protein